MGRNKKLEVTKRLEGTFRPDRANKNKPKTDNDLPEVNVPFEFDAVSKKFFAGISITCDNMNVTNKSDGVALYMIAKSYSLWYKMRKKLDTLDVTDPAFKNVQVVEKDAWARVFNGLKLFGLTPIDREKVSALDADTIDENNILD